MTVRLKRLLRSRRGEVTTSFILSAFLIILIAMFGMEYAAALEKYDYALDLIQRAVNTSVEYSIRDEFRSDRVLLMDTEAAKSRLYRYIDSDVIGHGGFTIVIDDVSAFETPPSMTVSGTGSFPTLLSRFGAGNVTFSFAVTSTNYDLDA